MYSSGYPFGVQLFVEPNPVLWEYVMIDHTEETNKTNVMSIGPTYIDLNGNETKEKNWFMEFPAVKYRHYLGTTKQTKDMLHAFEEYIDKHDAGGYGG
jgi:hypothetical protein